MKDKHVPYNSSHQVCHGYQVVADTLSTAWSCVNEVGGNFDTHFNRWKNKAFRSQTNNQILQITSTQGHWWVYYLLLSDLMNTQIK